MWPFKKKKIDPLAQFKEDVEKLEKISDNATLWSVGFGGWISEDFCKQFVDQYLICRQRHGEHFIHLVNRVYIPLWKQNADEWKKNTRIMYMLFANNQLATLLRDTHKCPEIDDISKYLSTAAKQAREVK